MQIYAPTSERKYDEDIEALYKTIKNTIEDLQEDNINLIMGDFNAKIEQGRRSDSVSDYGLGESNERGGRLFEFYQGMEVVVTNTWFKLSKRRLYTWKSPVDKANSPEPVRNQIDYILINKLFRNIIKRVTTHPGADIGSDHNPLVADLTLRLKVVKRKSITRKSDISKLRIAVIRENAAWDLNNKLERIEEINQIDINTQWNKIKRAILKTSEQHLRPSK